MADGYIRRYGTVSGNRYKVYVPVNVTFDAEGNMHPTELLWEDGNTYTIDRVKHIAPRPALKAGGQGDRYEVVIDGKITYLFYEHNPDTASTLPGRWFTEKKDPEKL